MGLEKAVLWPGRIHPTLGTKDSLVTCVRSPPLCWPGILPGSSKGHRPSWVHMNACWGAPEVLLQFGTWGYTPLWLQLVVSSSLPASSCLASQASAGLNGSVMGTGGELELTIGTSPVSRAHCGLFLPLPPAGFASLCVSASQAASITPTVYLPGLPWSLRCGLEMPS